MPEQHPGVAEVERRLRPATPRVQTQVGGSGSLELSRTGRSPFSASVDLLQDQTVEWCSPRPSMDLASIWPGPRNGEPGICASASRGSPARPADPPMAEAQRARWSWESPRPCHRSFARWTSSLPAAPSNRSPSSAGAPAARTPSGQLDPQVLGRRASSRLRSTDHRLGHVHHHGTSRLVCTTGATESSAARPFPRATRRAIRRSLVDQLSRRPSSGWRRSIAPGSRQPFQEVHPLQDRRVAPFSRRRPVGFRLVVEVGVQQVERSRSSGRADPGRSSTGCSRQPAATAGCTGFRRRRSEPSLVRAATDPASHEVLFAPAARGRRRTDPPPIRCQPSPSSSIRHRAEHALGVGEQVGSTPIISPRGTCPPRCLAGRSDGA